METKDRLGVGRGHQIDDRIRAGGIVVASSERAARSIRSAFNRRRLAEGLTAWPTPRIFEWKTFIREQWDLLPSNGSMVMSILQEEWLWARIAAASKHSATVLHGARHRLANMAREAHELLCSYAPHLLDSAARIGWTGDAEVFSEWLAEFDRRCAAEGWLSTTRLPLEMLLRLRDETTERPHLLLAGFDRILPAQRIFLDVWGRWELLEDNEETAAVRYFEARDAAAELAACALWCRNHLENDPEARLLVVSQDAAQRRGEIERAFSRHLAATPPLEFSLGVPLSQVPLVRGALLVLRWLTKSIAENELDWLLSSELTVENNAEMASLLHSMRQIRLRNHQRPEWTLEAFLNAQPGGAQLPDRWARRMLTAARLLQPSGQKKTALEWADLVPRLMKEAGWPGAHPMPSANFQALEHWNRTVEACGTLGFDEDLVGWPVFHSALARQMEDSLFAPESQNANILISGPAQSGGLVADGIWFLGVEEDTWPLAGSTHPFLPLFVQREAGMPHSTTQGDSDLSRIITRRLLHSATEVCFSHAKLRGKAEANPSLMAIEVAGVPVTLPPNLVPDPAPAPSTEPFEDGSRVQLAGTKAPGGSGTLTDQSQCAFRAFARARLGARDWGPAETGLSPRQRGDLVHSVLHAIWGGPAKNGWRSSVELETLLRNQGSNGIEQFVSGHVHSVMEQDLPTGLRDRLPVRYLEIEEMRLVKLITEWLQYEATRAPFTVAKTEEKTSITIAGLGLDLRLDRLDTLDDGSSLIIDYKTGSSTDAWELPRPEDVQLPLYSTFAVNQVPSTEPGGLVIATVRTGEAEFRGRVRQAAALLPNLLRANSLVKDPLTDQQLDEWRAAIEQLARDFLSGRATVNPGDYPTTCEHCGLQTLCRVEENMQLGDLDDAAEADDDQ